jgi:hypothetical protein
MATMLVAVGLFGATLGGLGGVASATSATKSQDDYCKAALNVGQDIKQAPVGSEKIPKATAVSFQKTYNKLAKLSPTKELKKANATVAAYYGQLAKGKTPADLGAKQAEAFANAIKTFSLNLATKCVASAIPDVTLPGGGKVSIPGA